MKAIDRNDDAAVEQLERQLVDNRKSLRADLEEQKAKVWQRSPR